jgi:hypothetical protein
MSSNLSQVHYPFSEAEENYFASFWMQDYTHDVLDLASSFTKRFTSQFFAECLIKSPNSWKWLAFVNELILGSSQAQQVHQSLMQRISTDVKLSSANKAIAEEVTPFPRFNFPLSKTCRTLILQ